MGIATKVTRNTAPTAMNFSECFLCVLSMMCLYRRSIHLILLVKKSLNGSSHFKSMKFGSIFPIIAKRNTSRIGKSYASMPTGIEPLSSITGKVLITSTAEWGSIAWNKCMKNSDMFVLVSF